jgi:hypothetical protein
VGEGRESGRHQGRLSDQFVSPVENARTPAGAVPPLSYQIDAADAIVAALTDVDAGGFVYRVQEIWKSAEGSPAVGATLALDTRMHELLGYAPARGQAVVLFFTGAQWLSPLEMLPVVEGEILYSPHDATVQERLTPARLKARVSPPSPPRP